MSTPFDTFFRSHSLDGKTLRMLDYGVLSLVRRPLLIVDMRSITTVGADELGALRISIAQYLG